MRKKIHGIQQFEEETLHEYWKRFKELCSSCPQHQISDQMLVLHFYDGLSPIDLYMVDKASGGPLIDKIPDEAMKLLETMATNPQQFRNGQPVTIRVDEIIPTDVEVPEQRNCSVFDRPDLDFITSQDSSNISCYDSVVVRISDSTDTVFVDVIGDASTDVDDDVSVGDCILEAIPQESPEPDVDDESVGTYAVKAEPQESLPLDTLPEPESELLSDDEEVTVTILEPPGTFQHDKVSLSCNSLEDFIKVPLIDFVGCDIFFGPCNVNTNIFPYLQEVLSSFGFVGRRRLPKWLFHLNRLRPPGRIFKGKMLDEVDLTSIHNIPFPKWILHLNRLQPPGKTISLPAWILLLNRLQPPGIKGSSFLVFFFLFVFHFLLLLYFTFALISYFALCLVYIAFYFE
ncbi:uncharacterized protein LOC122052108 isoform X1 [Zingiber officinale]|uniref:uncharacterized protein LOC122052108 isoform X1 n=1 Tax=Zingiber officinale TaxID=94328 RepID=UPI001C4ABD9D|nr:uncharacterized protein LOC122052108 isoform X1 [Zingiber officinale]XP_042469446.1 uncharacterized protein LOC122052108 isoform X1 [Zingiber officinale]XP_042469447.1 uncharacterized protein LOC122052108 isoform X1 [Zingiber officinale]XP_042469448.1 uncharacterized protein LOC122052108 isoform X1 [Zingiber officinale]